VVEDRVDLSGLDDLAAEQDVRGVDDLADDGQIVRDEQVADAEREPAPGFSKISWRDPASMPAQSGVPGPTPRLSPQATRGSPRGVLDRRSPYVGRAAMVPPSGDAAERRAECRARAP